MRTKNAIPRQKVMDDRLFLRTRMKSPVLRSPDSDQSLGSLAASCDEATYEAKWALFDGITVVGDGAVYNVLCHTNINATITLECITYS